MFSLPPSLLEDLVSQEAWFALVDNLAAATSLSQDKKKGRAFVTFLPNENRELSFDVTEFMRHKKAEVTDRLHISNVLLLLLLKLLLLKNPKPIRNQIKVIGKAYMSPVKRICVFEHSVMTNFNCACPAIQRGQGSGFLSEGSS